MTSEKEKVFEKTEVKVKGFITEKGVKVTEKQSIDELSSRGYGTLEEKAFLLTFYEALYLLEKGLLTVENENNKEVDFQGLLQIYKRVEENAWAKYLVYRDLRSRGYIIREGFGLGVDFRVYERGEYGKDTAKYLILNVQEGKPISVEDLIHIMKQCQRLKKELVLAVMNRRGETVYYSLSQLNLP